MKWHKTDHNLLLKIENICFGQINDDKVNPEYSKADVNVDQLGREVTKHGNQEIVRQTIGGSLELVAG